jgi:hypothetical protein
VPFARINEIESVFKSLGHRIVICRELEIMFASFSHVVKSLVVPPDSDVRIDFIMLVCTES